MAAGRWASSWRPDAPGDGMDIAIRPGMKHHTFIHKMFVGMSLVALLGVAACGMTMEEGEETAGVGESALGNVAEGAAALSSQEEDTAEDASALAAAAGKCVVRCCNNSVHTTQTVNGNVCIQWAESVCQNRGGSKVARFRNPVIRAWQCR